MCTNLWLPIKYIIKTTRPSGTEELLKELQEKFTKTLLIEEWQDYVIILHMKHQLGRKSNSIAE